MRIKWTDDDVRRWAEAHVSNGYTTLETTERNLGIPHSTLWWCFQRRLPGINRDLYDKVMARLEMGRHKGGRHRKERQI